MDEEKNQNNVSELLKRVDELTKVVESQSEHIDLLSRAADKHRMARLRRPEHQPTVIKVSTIDGKVVTGWKLTEDYVRADRNGLIERQTVRLELDDKTFVELPYADSFHKILKVPAEVSQISTETDKSGETRTHYTVEVNGKTHKIDSRFIN